VKGADAGEVRLAYFHSAKLRRGIRRKKGKEAELDLDWVENKLAEGHGEE